MYRKYKYVLSKSAGRIIDSGARLSGGETNSNAARKAKQEDVQIVDLRSGLVADQRRIPLDGLALALFQRAFGLIQLPVDETFGLRMATKSTYTRVVHIFIDVCIDFNLRI